MLEGILLYRVHEGGRIRHDGPESTDGWDKLFLTRPIESRVARSKNHNEEDDADDDGGSSITLKDLWGVSMKVNPKKAVGVDNTPGIVVWVLIEKGAKNMLRVLNAVNGTGKTPARWKVAMVVLIPIPGPKLTSSFWSINVLPVLTKVWEHTFQRR
jgi:hypothetical protein